MLAKPMWLRSSGFFTGWSMKTWMREKNAIIYALFAKLDNEYKFKKIWAKKSFPSLLHTHAKQCRTLNAALKKNRWQASPLEMPLRNPFIECLANREFQLLTPTKNLPICPFTFKRDRFVCAFIYALYTQELLHG